MTTRQFISDALMEIGILGADETTDPADADLALRHLQGMVDLLQSDRLLLYTVQSIANFLVPGKYNYSVGPATAVPTPDWVGPRPLWIAFIGVYPVSNPSQQYPVLPYHLREDYLAEPYPSYASDYPTRYFYEPLAPTFGAIVFWPVPTTAAKIVVSTAKPLDAPLTLDTDLVFPPGGYLEAWRLNLAKRLERPFSVPEDQGLRLDAMQALSRIRRLTDEVAPFSRSDAAVTGDGTYDIRGGTYR